MKNHPNAVTIQPYFKINPGEHEAALSFLPRFVEKTSSEAKCLFYGFTRNGDELFCQEGYEDAEGVLAHLANVGEMLQQFMKHAAMTRLEIHGPAAELDKLRASVAELNPAWFVWQCGL